MFTYKNNGKAAQWIVKNCSGCTAYCYLHKYAASKLMQKYSVTNKSVYEVVIKRYSWMKTDIEPSPYMLHG